MKTAISIPDPVFKAAEELSKELGISRSRLYAIAVARFVELHSREQVREALDEVYAEESSDLDPVSARMQFETVSVEDW